jgi:hypothetical protein
VAQVAKYLLTKHEVLSQTPVLPKNERKMKKKKLNSPPPFLGGGRLFLKYKGLNPAGAHMLGTHHQGFFCFVLFFCGIGV